MRLDVERTITEHKTDALFAVSIHLQDYVASSVMGPSSTFRCTFTNAASLFTVIFNSAFSSSIRLRSLTICGKHCKIFVDTVRWSVCLENVDPIRVTRINHFTRTFLAGNFPCCYHSSGKEKAYKRFLPCDRSRTLIKFYLRHLHTTIDAVGWPDSSTIIQRAWRAAS